ncbi:STAS domain-containing protein [Bythopirellula goksoeyrii]|uniref:STAS domain protein n=1 Tax=Bythopirellula goksoeyrii TaxID=1400387 RepID=A0A5B9Q1K4_9BACT|nr:STAS domain-containing protein [Bythopirellula goksoeyrii]QEG32858.1 STAS domain protein [Bythopirellula goksoeyrii]
MPIQTTSKDGILTIHILDDRLVEPVVLERLFEDLNTEVNKSTEDRVIIDFSPVLFMASSALSKLVQLNKKSKEYNAKLKLSGICPEIMEVFKITKLNKVFDIAANEDAARKAFNKTGLFR